MLGLNSGALHYFLQFIDSSPQFDHKKELKSPLMVELINPNGAGGAHCAHTFFGHLFLLKIKVLEGPNFLTFPICL